jgi:hypothetical protein
MRDRCDMCRFWHRGYRLQSMKMPSFCNKHFHSQAGDDPACKQFEHIDTRSIQHPPYDHPGDVA